MLTSEVPFYELGTLKSISDQSNLIPLTKLSILLVKALVFLTADTILDESLWRSHQHLEDLDSCTIS